MTAGDAFDELGEAERFLLIGDHRRARQLAEDVLHSIDRGVGESFLAYSLALGVAGEAAYAGDDLEAAAGHLAGMRLTFRISDVLLEPQTPKWRALIGRYAWRSHLYADVLHQRGTDLEEAVSCRLEAAALLIDIEDMPHAGHVLRDVADIERQLRRFDAAKDHVGQALAIFESLGDPVMQSNCLLGLGSCAQDQGDIPGALTFYRRARSLVDDQADAFLDRAHATAALGEATPEIDAALPLLHEALGLFEQHLEACLQADADVRKARLYLAQHVSAIASRALRGGRYDEARARLRQAEALFSQIADPMGRAEALYQLAFLAFVRGHSADCIALSLKAREQYRAAGWTPGELQSDLLFLKAIGRDGDLDTAVRGMETPRAKASQANLADTEEAVRLTLIDVHLARVRRAGAKDRHEYLEAARAVLEEAAALSAGAGPYHDVALLESTADFERLSGDLPNAIARYEDAARQYRELGDLREAACRYLQAEIAAELEDWPECSRSARLAIEALEARRQELPGPVLRHEFGRSWIAPYTLAAEAALSQDQGDEAFELTALLNGRLLGEELLRRGSLDAPPPLPRRDRRFPSLPGLEGLPAGPMSAAFERTRQHNEQVDSARFADDRLRGLSLARLRSPRALAAATKTTAITFLWTENRHAGFACLPDGTVQSILYGEPGEDAPSWREIDALVAQVRRLLEENPELAALMPTLVTDAIEGLRHLLWQPLAAVLRDSPSPVRISVPAALAVVPFLHFAAESGLDLVVVPALGAHAPAVASPANHRLLFAGHEGGGSTAALRGSRVDAALARDRFGNAGSIFVETSEAGGLLSQKGHFDVLAVSSHMHSAASAHATGIAIPSSATGQDLSAFELLLEMQATADTVVLLGCESAAPGAGPDIVSAAASVLVGARASHIIGTLWPVSDTAATLLWAALSSELAQGLSAPRALSAALARLDAPRDALEADDLVQQLLAGVTITEDDLEAITTAACAVAARGNGLLLPGDRLAWTLLGR